MGNYDYKKKMNQNRKRYAKRSAGVALATTLVISPVAPNVLSSAGIQDVFGVSVAHAATENLGEGTERTFREPFYHSEY